MMRANAYVASVGARTSIGLDAMQTAMLFRAGSCGMRQAALLDDGGEPLTMCFLPTLDPLSSGWERAAALAMPALEEALRPLSGRIDGRSISFELCIHERYGTAGRGSQAADDATALCAKLQERAHNFVPGIALDVTARGGASGAFAISKALSQLTSRRMEAVVVGGVHSDYEPAWIRELSGRGRLFKPDNLDSFIPGEAAAFAVLMREDAMRRVGLSPMAGVVSAATGVERATPEDDHSAYEAHGLTSTMRSATLDMQKAQLTAGWAFTDLTFEMRRLAEWQAMVIRTRKLWSEPYVVESPAQRIGQLGAAAIPLGLVLCGVGWKSGSAPAPVAVCYGGSDAGDRGAALLAIP